MAKRRKRSHLTIQQCHAALDLIAPKVDRMLVGSHGIEPHTNTAIRRICVCLEVRGGFGVADDFFEAIRVLAGHKLPALKGK